MTLFGKKENITTSAPDLNKELSLQIEMNQELKTANEALKKELLLQQKSLARFEKDFRVNPASQLGVLYQELLYIRSHLNEITSLEVPSVHQQIEALTKDICVEAFELLNLLKEPEKA